MASNISIFPMVHKHRLDKSGNVPLVIRIDFNHKPVAYDKINGRGQKIPLDAWDGETRTIRRSYPNAAILNNAIRKRTAEIEGMLLLKEQNGTPLTARTIKMIVTGTDPGRCYFTFCEKQIKDKHENPETIRTYMSEVTKIRQFRRELSFADIDYMFLQEYAAYMRDVLGNAPNTIWKTFKFMNTMMNDAVKVGGIIDENPFKEYDRGQYRQTQRTFLTKKERAKVEEVLYMPCLDKEIEQITLYLLFMVYCGLRFEDAMSFRYDAHIIDDERLIMVTEKADEPVNIKLYPKLREVVLAIRDRPLHITNQAFNRLLKPIAVLAGINKNLTAHVGRHSFGRLLAESGVDKGKAQKLLAHRDKRSTDVYYHMLDEDVDKEVDSKLGHL